jgi:cleavage and polyadenylation specificity factor subunit 1
VDSHSSILQEAEKRHATILDADYSAVDIEPYVDELDHLTTDQKKRLIATLQKRAPLFQGGLGLLRIKPVRLELEDDAQPYHARPYDVPHAFAPAAKKEIDRLTEIGVLERNSDSEWAAPTFVQPKKTGDIRVLTDFRRLNAKLRRKPYPLPKINDLLFKLEGFQYATAIDLSMGYYHIPLDRYSQMLCTTILPWGKYRYKRLPMGIKNSPDIFQNIMADLLGDLEFARTYIDDILIISKGDFDDHLQKVDQVLERLENAGFRANVRKCSFAKDSLEYLGYQVTRQGIQPQAKKVQAILNIAPPKTTTQLRRFLGMVNYYRDMWRRRSHLTAPLTQYASGKRKLKWTPELQECFEGIKRIIARETMLTFPDFSKEFHVYTDASDYQLGAVLMQDQKPLAFYSRKLSGAQKNYTTGEQELLSVVETLKEFKNILLGHKIVIHTDHKNLLYEKTPSARLMRWRHLLEEFAPQWEHVKGVENVVADALSRLDLINTDTSTADEEGEEAQEAYAFVTSDDVREYEFPLHPRLLYEAQQTEPLLLEAAKLQPPYGTRVVEGYELITYKDKIYVSKPLQDRVAAWYHDYLCHPGENRTESTIRLAFTWPGLRNTVKQYCKTCRECQKAKKPRKKYGHLPMRDVEVKPWSSVNVDLIGPYTVQTPTQTHTLRALTIIDPITRWFEVVPVANASAPVVARAFKHTWLMRYPRPQAIGFDNGGEFKSVFRALCHQFGLKEKPSGEYNPQSNGVLERMHQTLANALRTFELEQRELDPVDPWTPFLSAAAFAIRSTHHPVLEATPGQVVFGRDMMLPIEIQTNWALIAERQKAAIAKNNARENSKRIAHNYQVGDKVLLTLPGIRRKLSTPCEGPFEVIATHTNGTVRIQRGAVSQRVNIRRLTPFYEPPRLGSE